MEATDRKLRLHIWTGNAAFGETEADEARECARILRETADRLDAFAGMEVTDADFRAERTLFDANGNDVGRVAIKSVDEFEGGRISAGRANEVLRDLSYPVEV